MAPSGDPSVDGGTTGLLLCSASRTLASGGYASLSLTKVAADVGVHRSAIYRRWPGRLQLAIHAVREAMADVVDPRSGEVGLDLEHFLRTAATTRGGHGQPMFVELAVTGSPELASMRSAGRWLDATARAIVDRAARTGAIDGSDLSTSAEVVFAAAFAYSSAVRERRSVGTAGLIDLILNGFRPLPDQPSASGPRE
ncbi:MAG: Transcriptional regulator, TetR family [Aeromicrobium sp.]|nr:Transcriptional regulator, TetR family [Aeromicrobium sp.]